MASQTQAKIVIKGQNDVKDAVKGASSDLMGLTQTLQKVGSAFRSAFTVTAIIGAVKQLCSAISTMVTEDFGEANRAYAQLAMALGDSSAYDAVVENMDRLSRQTLAANGDIEAMVAELAALGKGADEINSISNAAVALSNVTGKDLSSSMTIMLATLNGTTTQLKRLGIDLGDVTEEELKSGAAIEIVNERFGQYSEALARQDIRQPLKNMSETWGDIREKIGGVVAYLAGPMVTGMDKAFATFGEKVNSITTYIGAVIANLPEVFSLTMDTIGRIIGRTFKWESIKRIVSDTVSNIGSLIAALFEGILRAIPDFLSTAGRGVVKWLAYIGTNLKMEVKKAVTDVINELGEKLSGTWVGNLFGIGGKLESFRIDTTRDERNAAIYRTQYQEAFGGFGEVFREHIGSAVDAVKETTAALQETGREIYGDILAEHSTALADILAPELEEIRHAADAADQSALLSQLAETTAALERAVTLDGTGTEDDPADGIRTLVDSVEAEGGDIADILQAIVDEYGAAMQGIVIPGFEAVQTELEESDSSDTLEQIERNTRGSGRNEYVLAHDRAYSGPMQKLVDRLEGTLSDLFDLVTLYGEAYGKAEIRGLGEVMAQVVGPLIEALSPLVAVVDSIIDPVQVLTRLVEGVVNILAPALQTVVQPLLDTITYIGDALGRLLLPILDPLCAAFNLLGQILMTAIVPVFQMLSPVFEVLGLIVTAINPILILLAKAFTILMSPVQFLADLFSWLGKWVEYLGHCIYVATYNLTHWFSPKSFGSSPGGFSSDAFSGLQGRLDAIDELAMGTGTGASDSVSTDTSIASASYQGGTTVTINIYQQAPVVGDGGMAAFARMIRREFEALDHYGVTT